jgi:hypothetical protein
MKTFLVLPLLVTQHVSREPKWPVSLSKKKMLQILHSEAPDYLSIPGSHLSYLGTLKNEKATLHVVKQTFRSSKETKRLLFVSTNFHFLGMYVGFDDFPKTIKGSSIIFDGTDELGNRIDVTEVEPPASAYVDGRHYEFLKK